MYEAPRLKRFGNFRELTLSASPKDDVGFDLLVNNGQTQINSDGDPRS